MTRLPDATPTGMDFDTAVLGVGLAPAVEALITRAGELRSSHAQAESMLLQARQLEPAHPATLIALYRFYFYGHRLQQARDVSVEALRVARAALDPGSAGADLLAGGLTVDDEQARFGAATRFYLFSLRGYAYLSLRLGELDTGRAALDELRRLDPQDRVGGGVLAQVLARAEAGVLEDDLDGVPASAALATSAPRGWGLS